MLIVGLAGYSLPLPFPPPPSTTPFLATLNTFDAKCTAAEGTTIYFLLTGMIAKSLNELSVQLGTSADTCSHHLIILRILEEASLRCVVERAH